MPSMPNRIRHKTAIRAELAEALAKYTGPITRCPPGSAANLDGTRKRHAARDAKASEQRANRLKGTQIP
jgi:tRNA U55 pseudouridine synthase TruB